MSFFCSQKISSLLFAFFLTPFSSNSFAQASLVDDQVLDFLGHFHHYFDGQKATGINQLGEPFKNCSSSIDLPAKSDISFHSAVTQTEPILIWKVDIAEVKVLICHTTKDIQAARGRKMELKGSLHIANYCDKKDCPLGYLHTKNKKAVLTIGTDSGLSGDVLHATEQILNKRHSFMVFNKVVEILERFHKVEKTFWESFDKVESEKDF